MFQNSKRVTKSGICIPINVRRDMNIHPGDMLDVHTDEKGSVVLTPHNPRCVFCGETEGVMLYQGKGICNICIEDIKEGFASGE